MGCEWKSTAATPRDRRKSARKHRYCLAVHLDHLDCIAASDGNLECAFCAKLVAKSMWSEIEVSRARSQTRRRSSSTAGSTGAGGGASGASGGLGSAAAVVTAPPTSAVMLGGTVAIPPVSGGGSGSMPSSPAHRGGVGVGVGGRGKPLIPTSSLLRAHLLKMGNNVPTSEDVGLAMNKTQVVLTRRLVECPHEGCSWRPMVASTSPLYDDAMVNHIMSASVHANHLVNDGVSCPACMFLLSNSVWSADALYGQAWEVEATEMPQVPSSPTVMTTRSSLDTGSSSGAGTSKSSALIGLEPDYIGGLPYPEPPPTKRSRAYTTEARRRSQKEEQDFTRDVRLIKAGDSVVSAKLPYGGKTSELLAALAQDPNPDSELPYPFSIGLREMQAKAPHPPAFEALAYKADYLTSEQVTGHITQLSTQLKHLLDDDLAANAKYYKEIGGAVLDLARQVYALKAELRSTWASRYHMTYSEEQAERLRRKRVAEEEEEEKEAEWVAGSFAARLANANPNKRSRLLDGSAAKAASPPGDAPPPPSDAEIAAHKAALVRHNALKGKLLAPPARSGFWSQFTSSILGNISGQLVNCDGAERAYARYLNGDQVDIASYASSTAQGDEPY